jgi:hypothetical protein
MRAIQLPVRASRKLLVSEPQAVVAWPSAWTRIPSVRMNQGLGPVLTWVVRLAIVFLIVWQIAPLARGQVVPCSPAASPLKISPVAASVLPSGNVQFLSRGVSDPLEWFVNDISGGNSEIGTISGGGLYIAPPKAPDNSVIVTAVSTKDRTARDSAAVLFGRQPITLTPLAATVATDGCVELYATWLHEVKGNLKWKVNGVENGNGGFGGIKIVSENEARYTAPSNIDTASTVTVTLSSQDAPFSASATIVIVKPSCPIEKCVEIVLKNKLTPYREINPRISSVPLKPGEKLQLAATSPDSSPVEWAVTADVNNPGATGKFLPEKTTATTTTYQAPSESESPSMPITITATPTKAGYTGASIKILVMKQVLARCYSVTVPTTSWSCSVTDFDRLKGETGQFPSEERTAKGEVIEARPVNSDTDAGVVTAINASKTIFSGSVLAVNLTDVANGVNCASYDWKIVVQSKEATSVLIYDPSDIGSGVCEGNRFIVALPVHVLWAEVYGYHQNLDPSRAAPAKPSSFTDCVGQPAIQTITPCDVGTSGIVAGGYHAEWLLSHFSAPGNGKGAITFTGKGEVIYDVQADPAYKAGIGWFNVPVVFERGPAGANLNSLTFGVAYDFRPVAHPDWNWGKPGATSHFIFRKPQFQIRSGPEMSPSRPGTASTTGNEHSWNYTWGETVKFPLVLNFHDQPSSFSFYSIFGAEEGWHIATNLPTKDPIARGLAGGNASFRWPFNVTHNFLGTTPITFEAQYLVRWLAYPEPFADFANLPPAGTAPPCPRRVGIGVITSSTGQLTCGAVEALSSKAQSLFRGDISFPLDPYIQVTASVTKGSLPPSFWLIGWTYSLGLTFGNNASSEH